MNITFGGNPVTLVGNPLQVGDRLPDFNLTALDLSNVSSRDLKLPALILVFPSVDTSVCSLELLTFNDRLDGMNYNVYGVSADLPFAMDRWVKSNAGEFITMVSDYKENEFGKATGTLVDEFKILARAAYIVDAKGVVRYAEYVPEIGTEPDYDKILEEAKAVFEG